MSSSSRPFAEVDKSWFFFIDEFAKGSKENRRRIRSQARLHTIAKRYKTPWEMRSVNGVYKKKSQVSSSKKPTTELEVHKPGITITAGSKLVVIPDLPKRGYEAARILYGFDVFLLSGLASVHMGRRASLQLQHTKLEEWLVGHQEASYLDYIPSCYDSSPLLQSTVDCMMAQYKNATCPASVFPETMVLRLYDQALQNLQAALHDRERCMQPDVLLSTAVLQLYEVSSPTVQTDICINRSLTAPP
jgi:hypothetical protein